MPFTPKIPPSVFLATGSEVYARRRGTGFMDSTMPKYFYAEPVPGIVMGMLPGDRYLVVLADQNEVVVLDRRQLWVSSSGRPHRLAPE
jgi:hypothetical protein